MTSHWARITRNFRSLGPDGLSDTDVAMVLTLVTLLLHAGRPWYLSIPTTLVCSLALVLPRLRNQGGFWFVLAFVLAYGNARDWYVVDNHKYLMTYWCLAIGLALSSRVDIVLPRSARLLVAGCFAFAVIWKLLSPDYLDARFFTWTLLTDGRFQWVAETVGGLDPWSRISNGVRIQSLMQGNVSGDAVTLAIPATLTVVAQVLTWWTIVIESVLVLAFLAPRDSRIGRLRHVLLLGFGVTTYTIATVIGFGWLIMAMGVAQAGSSRLRAAYVAVFLLVCAYSAPWAGIASFLGGLPR